MTYAKPLPAPDPSMQPFWEAAKKHKLVVQTCNACGKHHFPPAPSCSNCLSDDQSWTPTGGHGTLESWIDFHHGYWAGFREALPYRVCLVRLDEGPLLISNLPMDGKEPALGAGVHAVFDAVTDTVTLPKFELDE